MSPSDQIQDLFDRAMSSIPEQPVPSADALYDRLSRHRVRFFISGLGGSIASAFLPRGRQPRVPGGRLRPSIVITALAVVAVVALVAGLVIVGSKNSPAPRSPSTSSGALSFRLVDMTGNPFRSVSPGATAYELQCVTDLVCYSPGAPQSEIFRTSDGRLTGSSQNVFFQTTDGGLNWVKTAPLPLPSGSPGWSLLSFSCPTVGTCAIVYILALPATLATPTFGDQLAQLVITSDGGAHWKSSAIPVPKTDPSPGGFACGDANHCVLGVTGTTSGSPSQRFGTFLLTSDAGRTWTQSTSAPSTPAGAVSTLKCSADGSCLAISERGKSPKSYVVGLRTKDWGLTWSAGPPVLLSSSPVDFLSCGDTTHCMMVLATFPLKITTPLKIPLTIATTSNAGETWQVSDTMVGWENMPTAVSCANVNDCWIATSTYNTKITAFTYSNPVIESTHNGGATWSSVGLPIVTPPLADVVTLSCPPSGDGCMGVGNLRFRLPLKVNRRLPYEPQPVPQVISNLPAAN